MATFDVDVGGVTYEVDAPDEQTAWQWANQTHAQETSQEAPSKVETEPQNKSLAETYLDYQVQGGKELLKGVLGGASRIGNTLINASTAIPRQISPELEQWNQERQASLEDFRKGYADSGIAQAGDIATQIAGTAGVGNVLKVPALAAGMPRLAEALGTGGFSGLSTGKVIPNALLRLAAGAGVGGASTAMVSPEDVGTGAAVGAGSVAVLNPILKGAALGAGKLADFVSGRLPAVRAAKIARDVAGPNLDEIRRANLVAPEDITSAQAAVDVPRFEWANLGQRAQQGDPTAYGLKVDAQEAKRLATLDAVTPDLASAESMREKVTVPLYKKVLESTKKVNTKPVTNLVDKFIEDNPKLASIRGPMSEIKNGLVGDTNVKSLVSLSQNIKEKIAAKNPDGTPMFDVKALTKVKESLDQQIGRAEPKYNTARNAYKRLSAPINQAKLLQEMKNTLVSSKGGERVTPFLNAMGQGEKSLFRRADQSARFGSIDEVLTPKQRQAKDKIVAELRRDAEVSRRSKESAKKVSEVISGDSIRARLPSLVDKWFSAANKGIDIAESGINKKTMAAISEGMKSGKSANEMLAVLPAEEQNKILKALIKMPKGAVVPSAAGVLTQED